MNYYYLSKFIAGIYRRSKNEFNKEIIDLNVRATESDLLLFIAENPNLMQQEIAIKMVIDPSLLAKDLRGLQQKGMVTRNVDVEDRRVKRITTTDKGEETVKKLQETMEQWWRKLFIKNSELDPQIFYDQLLAGYNAITFGKDKQK